MKKNTIIALVIGVVVIAGGLLIWNWSTTNNQTQIPTDQGASTTTPSQASSTPSTATTTAASENKPETVIGKSADGHDITAYHFGQGGKEILFIGGIHGGYSWNTALLAQNLITYLKDNSGEIPDGVKVTVIPVLNPDGLEKVTGTTDGDFTSTDVSASQATLIAGRFNGNNVDLNRNFDCDWQASGTWQSRTVSGGSEAFSEPETQALKNYVEANKPTAVVAWYTSAGGVYGSNCGEGLLPETREIMKEYADASGYPASANFTAYKVTGDMVNWFAKNDIPAISVLLTSPRDTEWNKNLAGIKALLERYED